MSTEDVTRRTSSSRSLPSIEENNHSPSAPSSTSVARSYIEGFTIHGLSKVFTGRPLERLFWFFVLVAVLGFVGFKVYGSHQQYSSNQFRTEIREVDADNFTFPEIVFCSWQLMDKFSLPCYKGIRLDEIVLDHAQIIL